MSSRHMWAVVCDDVRQEVGNKVSCMGIYGAEIILPVLPVALPKLCAVLYVRTLTSDPFERLVLRILKDDAELVQMELPRDQLTAVKAHAGSFTEEGYLQVASIIQFSPFVIEQACTLRFRADTERETIKGGSLEIKPQVSPPSQQGQLS